MLQDNAKEYFSPLFPEFMSQNGMITSLL